LHRITGTRYGLNYHFDKNGPVEPLYRKLMQIFAISLINFPAFAEIGIPIPIPYNYNSI
jgi:hypothetical protein